MIKDNIEVIEVNVKPKKKTFTPHYLGRVFCPLGDGRLCNSQCAWFDHVGEKCNVLSHLFDIRQEIGYIGDLLTDDSR